MHIIIQAGGKGTRLEGLTKNKPKCLVPVDNLPIIFHIFQKFCNDRFTIIADYKADVLEKYLKCFASKVDYKIIKEYTSSEFMNAGQVKEKIGVIGMWNYLLRDNNKVVDKFGVACISVNMYEGFYNHSNTTKLFIYGIPEETFENSEKIDSGKYQYPNRIAILLLGNIV
ncbi:sugar phosphate nucleotidyltransferase [Helicobacter typhlonius]|uniref:sugar phosphate nucleotidyltransferase n=1 Tax=Helicobacter typhlonius TaxID=76936 RepID=UPI002FDF54B9